MKDLHASLETLASRGEEAGADTVFALASKATNVGSAVRISSSATPGLGRPRVAAFVVSFAAILGVLGLISLGTSGTDASDTGSLGPVVTMPPIDGVSMTVPPGADLSYYPYLPDLHLAWRAVEQGTEMCWASPYGDDCVTDNFYAPETVVVLVGEQAVVLSRPALTGPKPESFRIELSNGDVITKRAEEVRGIAIIHARFALPTGVSVISAQAS